MYTKYKFMFKLEIDGKATVQNETALTSIMSMSFVKKISVFRV